MKDLIDMNSAGRCPCHGRRSNPGILRGKSNMASQPFGAYSFLKHTVVPKNFRIAATARMIGTQNLTASVRRRASTPRKLNV